MQHSSNEASRYHRLPDGRIDYAYYRLAADRARWAAYHETAAMLMRGLRRTTVALFAPRPASRPAMIRPA